MAAKKKVAARALERPLFAVLADPHVGNHQRWGGSQVNGINARCRLTLDALEAAVQKAGDLGCRELFVAGDMFHTRRPEPAVIASVQKIFDQAKEGPEPMNIVIVPGNHDMLDADAAGGNTACAPLWESARVIEEAVTWNGIGGVDVVLIPYSARVPMAQHLMEKMGNLDRSPSPAVLVTHVGVWDDEDAKAAPWMRRAKDGISAPMLFDLMEKAKITTAFVGNYHNHRVWQRGDMTICQVGTLCPGSFGDEGLVDRGLMVTSSGVGFEKHEIPGPRFVTITQETQVMLKSRDKPNRFFLRCVDIDPGEGARAIFGGVEVVSSEAEKEEQASGATAGPRPQTPMEALMFHVEHQDLPEGVQRAAVADLVRDCWARGA